LLAVIGLSTLLGGAEGALVKAALMIRQRKENPNDA
jgi:hypothetical protein